MPPPRRRPRTFVQRPSAAGGGDRARQARRRADERGHRERDRRHVPSHGRGRGAGKDAALQRQAELEQPPRDQHCARRGGRHHARRRREVRDQHLTGRRSQRPQAGESRLQTAPAGGVEPAHVQTHQQQHESRSGLQRDQRGPHRGGQKRHVRLYPVAPAARPVAGPRKPDVGLRLRGARTDAGLQARDRRAQRGVASRSRLLARRHQDRRPELGPAIREPERLGHRPDQPVRRALELHGAAEPAAHQARPHEPLAHDDRRDVRQRAVRGPKCPTGRRLDTQHLEEVDRYVRPDELDRGRARPRHEVSFQQDVTRDVLER